MGGAGIVIGTVRGLGELFPPPLSIDFVKRAVGVRVDSRNEVDIDLDLLQFFSVVSIFLSAELLGEGVEAVAQSLTLLVSLGLRLGRLARRFAGPRSWVLSNIGGSHEVQMGRTSHVRQGLICAGIVEEIGR